MIIDLEILGIFGIIFLVANLFTISLIFIIKSKEKKFKPSLDDYFCSVCVVSILIFLIGLPFLLIGGLK